MARRVAVLLALGSALLFCGSPAARAGGARTFVIEGDNTRDPRLMARAINVLYGVVRVRAGATLRIGAGTTVQCGTGAVLVVEQGARLRAVGTKEHPIVFTSAQTASQRRRGDWAGIIVNGRAPVNVPGGIATDPSGTGTYGGYESNDSSGALRYVRIEFAGFPLDSVTRSSGIALRGVGSGTTFENVEALNGDGSGISVVGGDVNIARVASIGNVRAGFEFTSGWTGRGQFLVAQQRSDVRDAAYSGVLADHSSPSVQNLTLVGGAYGLTLGVGARGSYRNLVIAKHDRAAVSAVADGTTADVLRGDVVLDGAIVEASGTSASIDPDLRDALSAAGYRIAERAVNLVDPYDETAPIFRPTADSPALLPANLARDVADPYFAPAPYCGASSADAGDDWLDLWARFALPPSPRYLANAQPGPESVAREFLEGLAEGDVRRVQQLRIAHDEFCWYVWPELPASRLPNVTCDFAWSQATLGSMSGLAQTLNAYGGQRFELVSLRFAGGDEEFPSYVVHYDTLVVVRDSSGQERELKLFGSMLETNGQWKLFSFVAD